jgi:hypothetical protein
MNLRFGRKGFRATFFTQFLDKILILDKLFKFPNLTIFDNNFAFKSAIKRKRYAHKFKFYLIKVYP